MCTIGGEAAEVVGDERSGMFKCKSEIQTDYVIISTGLHLERLAA